MEYRSSDPQRFGFDDEREAVNALHGYVQGVMARTDPDDIMDTLVMMANICEIRSVLSASPELRTWYANAQKFTRAMLRHMGETDIARPDVGLENPTLYYPESTHTH